MRHHPRLACLLALVELLTGGASAAEASPPMISVRVSVSANHTGVLAGSGITVRGTASSGSAGTPVALQRFDGRRWLGLRSSTLGRQLGYQLAFVPPAGAYRYRVVVAAHGMHRAATSRTLTLHADSCPTASAPRAPSVAWFTRPGLRSRSPISTNTAATLCAAAPHSTVHIAMYFMTSGGVEVEPVFHAIELMHRYRGVTFQVVLEGRNYAGTGWARDTLARLQRSASVRLCQYGCRSEHGTSGRMHDKFLTISDTVWRSGTDPVLISSSGNISHGQLRDMWQSSQAFYSDPSLVREFDVRFDGMWSCGSTAGCGSWKGGTRPQDALTRTASVWRDAGAARAGSPGRGTSVAFAPFPAAVDPLLPALDTLSCTATHKTVRMAMFKTDAYRAPAYAAAVKRLRARGCSVGLLLGVPVDAVGRGGLAALKAQGLSTRCVPGLHEKATVVDAVDSRTGAPRTLLWAGSQNFTTSGLLYNDDTITRVSVQDARGAYAPAASAMWRGYRSVWDAMSRTAVAC